MPLRPLFLLIQLSARLTRRTYLTSRAALLTLGIALLGGIPAAARFALGLPGFLATLPPTSQSAYLSTLLGALFLMAALGPSVGAAALAQSADDARLRLLPVSGRTLALGLILGALADPLLLALVPPLLAALKVGGVGAFLPLLLLALCAVATGQFLLRLSKALTGARRFRESLALLGPLAAACVLILASRPPARAASVAPPQPVWKRLGPVLSLTPPGLGARAVAERTPWSALPLLLWTGGALLGTAALLQRRIERESATQRTRPARPLRLPLLPTDVSALIQKESALLRREPFYRGGLGRLGLTTAALVLGVLTPPDGPGDLLGFAGTGLLAWGAVWITQLACNQLGGDFTAGSLLLGFPLRPTRLLLGKSLALFGLLGPLLATILLLYGLAARLPAPRIALFVGYGGLWLLGLLGVGAILSVLAPYPLIPRRGADDSGREGASLLLGLVHLGAAALAGIVAIQAPWASPALWAVTLALAGTLLTRRRTALTERLDG